MCLLSSDFKLFYVFIYFFGIQARIVCKKEPTDWIFTVCFYTQPIMKPACWFTNRRCRKLCAAYKNFLNEMWWWYAAYFRSNLSQFLGRCCIKLQMSHTVKYNGIFLWNIPNRWPHFMTTPCLYRLYRLISTIASIILLPGISVVKIYSLEIHYFYLLILTWEN